MLAGELKARLADVEDDVVVYLSKDEEGNAFYELADVALEGVIYEGWGELSIYEEGYHDNPEDFGPGVILWP